MQKIVFYSKIPKSNTALEDGKLLGDYVGRNEKTRAVARLRRREAGAPGGERLTEEERRAVGEMSEKRRRELRHLDKEENTELLYSDTKELSRKFQGLDMKKKTRLRNRKALFPFNPPIMSCFYPLGPNIYTRSNNINRI